MMWIKLLHSLVNMLNLNYCMFKSRMISVITKKYFYNRFQSSIKNNNITSNKKTLNPFATISLKLQKINKSFIILSDKF